MEELKKGLDFALSEEKAKPYLDRVYSRISEWGLKMPNVEPLVLDFGLGDFEKCGDIEFWIANEEEAGYCGKFLFFFEGQFCPEHMHKTKTETFFIVKGTIDLLYDGKKHFMKSGDGIRFDTEKKHSFTAIEDSLVLEISKPSIISDNYFSDRKISIGSNYKPE